MTIIALMNCNWNKKYGYRYIQYDLQPTELDAHTFEEFVQLTSSFPGATYTDALEKGKVSYLEVAIDFLFKDTWDLLIHKSGVHSSYRYFPLSGAAPSVYTGAVKSASKSAAYTKTKPKIVGATRSTPSGRGWSAGSATWATRL